jgi:hypothetical protein
MILLLLSWAAFTATLTSSCFDALGDKASRSRLLRFLASLVSATHHVEIEQRGQVWSYEIRGSVACKLEHINKAINA